MEYYTKNTQLKQHPHWKILTLREFYDLYLVKWKMTYKTARIKLIKGDFPVEIYRTSDGGNFLVGFAETTIEIDIVKQFRYKQ
ncbi:hypothetical protein [Colwellia sp. Bg11-28]|uniref:hypothetical protein n=1 Tax=Colwellia sp. Bg11-28 TaxID=2058305 RepID=UPI000C3380EA|nr:hypothetical protein [Colwellia sp. Bg11-28]PKH86905.1 hypothetical protein CXF79_09235 [Colwellia sp. Bg11-28]